MDGSRPISYRVLGRGTPVFTSDGVRVGEVRKVLEVVEKDIFDGLILRTAHGARFVDAPEVGSIQEDRVMLTIDAAQAARLPRPGGAPAVLEASADDVSESPRAYKRDVWLKRVWGRFTGN